MQAIVPQVSPDTQVFDLFLFDLQVTEKVLALTCPRCGCELSPINLYVGGRGYQPYLICQNPKPMVCDYQKRQVM